MKKLFTIFISAVMALSVCACGGGAKPEETTTVAGTKKVNGIELTKDNYETYLNVFVESNTIDPIDYSTVWGDKNPSGSYVYKGFETRISVSGKSSNYDYNDVVVKVRITGSYVPFTKSVIQAINRGQTTMEEHVEKNHVEYNAVLTAKTDIIGSGNDSDKINLTDDSFLMVGLSGEKYEIIEVSGLMTK